MSISRCGKCEKSIFQIESITPIGSERAILCVICHNCNSIAGVLDHAEDEAEGVNLKVQFQILNKKLDTINQNIGQLMNGMKLMYKKLENGNS